MFLLEKRSITNNPLSHIGKKLKDAFKCQFPKIAVKFILEQAEASMEQNASANAVQKISQSLLKKELVEADKCTEVQAVTAKVRAVQRTNLESRLV